MHDQWEYKRLLGHGGQNILKDENGAEVGKFSTDLLNKLGKEGWEVCSHAVSPVIPAIVIELILKRRINPS